MVPEIATPARPPGDGPPARPRPPPRALAGLRIAFVVALLGPLLLLAYVGWTSHRDGIAAARDRLDRLAQIAQEHSQRVLETNEVISRALATRVGSRSNAELRAEREALHAELKSWTAGLPQLQSVWIWDETGRPVVTNLRRDPPADLDVSDRAYFVWARDPAASGWYVSAPLRSRTTGELFFDFVKRRSSQDGRFQGAVSVSLRPSYFDAFFREQLVSEPGFTLSLYRADGTLVSRQPPAPPGFSSTLGPSSRLHAAMAAGTAAGETEGFSPVDGQYRYLSYRRIRELPLYAVATGSRGGLLAPWRRSMALLTAVTLPLAAGLAALCWFAMQRVRREHAIALAHEEQYEQLLKAEQALRLSQKTEALGRLTGGVAHDFNNVLMVIQTSAALARQLEARGEPVGKALAPIERAVANGAQLTRQLLAVVRRQPLQARTVDLAAVVPGVVELMAGTLGRRIAVSHELDGRLCVTIDQAEFGLALMNLCINARDAMPDGGSLQIRASRVASPHPAGGSDWAQVSVTDTGRGIPPEILDRVSEPFFTTKPLGEGTGLGLSQVQAFVAQSGGVLEIDSEPGRGTRVSIRLPCAEPQARPPSAAAPAAALGRLDARVLLVEDNADIAQAVAGILRAAGAEVDWHASADGALDALADGPRPDLVLSDVSVPGEHDGIDLARLLAARHPQIPVVLMTGYTDRLDEATEAGFAVVPKPATPEALLRALIDALDRR